MNLRLALALGAYAIFSLLAAFTLEGKLRTAVWILMAGFAAKTWIAHRRGL
jgi:hypothetical protein